MQASKRSVLVAGATGLVGGEIVKQLIRDDGVAEIRLLVRRELPELGLQPKVKLCISNFDQLAAQADCYNVDQVFCSLGTTIKKAGSQSAFRRVDFEYPLQIAQLALAKGAQHFLLVSSVSANSKVKNFYLRTKGELEDALQQLNFKSLTVARPSFLLGERSEKRWADSVAKKLVWLMPPRWGGVQAAQVAAALVQSAIENRPGMRIMENLELREIRI